jgi:hypothetical protein
VTHPFHPLAGEVFDIVDRRCLEGGEYLYLEIRPGVVQGIPVAWTSLGATYPFVAMAAGRSMIRVDALLRLAEIVSELGEQLTGERAEVLVKGNMPNV